MKPILLKTLSKWLTGSSMEGELLVLGAAVDSRSVKPGDLFFALEGERADGHDYLQEAAGRGAVAAVVRSGYSGLSYGLPLVRVPDVLLALQQWAERLVQARPLRVVAITGSVGKTTTKEWIAALLAPHFPLFVSPGNCNSQVGLPLSLINCMQGEESVAVVEMAMDKPGQIARLATVLPPTVAVITTCSLVHAENFTSLEGIVRAKAEILTHPKTEMGIIPFEIPLLASFGDCEKRTFSATNAAADFFVEEGALVEFSHRHLLPSLPSIPPHHRSNLVAAIAVAREFGLNWEAILKQLPSLAPAERRFVCCEKRGATLVDDSYNACALSVCAALDHLPMPKGGGRRMAFLAGMRELGTFSEGCHRAVCRHARRRVDALFCLGEEYRVAKEEWGEENLFWTEERDLFFQKFLQEIRAGDVALVKGSRFWKLWELVEAF